MSTMQRTSWILTALVTALAAGAATTGLLVPGVYPGKAGTDAMLRGYDLLTLVVVVPALVLVLLAQRRPGRHAPARLLTISLLAYLAYTYAYYLLGAGFTVLLLLHAAVFSGALVALVLTLSAVDATETANAFSPQARVRPAAAVLALLAVALGGMWVYWSLHQAVTGDVPPGSALVESDTVVHLGIVLDLTLLVPLYAAAALLLWRRAPWGFVLGAVALVAGLLHQLSYVVALLAQSTAGVSGAVAFDPGEPAIILLYAGAAASLLLGLRRPAPEPHASDPTSKVTDGRLRNHTERPPRRSHAHAR